MEPSNKFSLSFCDSRNLIRSIRERSYFLNVQREFHVLFFDNSHTVKSVNKPQTSENIASFLEESVKEIIFFGPIMFDVKGINQLQ